MGVNGDEKDMGDEENELDGEPTGDSGIRL